jgi:alanyl-tRNA synthetase
MNKPNPKVDSALHVLKGAVEKVLSASLTTSVYAEENKGRLTVEYEQKPTEEEMQEIEKLANDKINENVPIEMFEIQRTEAEEKYGNAMYDKFPVPDHVKKLTLTRIADWNLNCCLGPHVENTGEIGALKIRKYRARPGKKSLEISFELQ